MRISWGLRWEATNKSSVRVRAKCTDIIIGVYILVRVRAGEILENTTA